jgi:hypothetical protein
MTPLHISNLGITLTGREKPMDPRKEYKASIKGFHILADFFGIPPRTFQNMDTTIWLTPATVEDLLILHTFAVEKCRFIVISTQTTNHVLYRELYAENDPAEAKLALANGDKVLPNSVTTHFKQSH